MGHSVVRKSPGWRSIAVALCVVAVFGFASWSRDARSDSTPALQVKAAYLRNFTKFVKWPEHSFHDKNSPLVIGVLGSDPFERALDAAIEGHKAHGRELRIRRLSVVDGVIPSKEQLSGCHLLFVSESERERLPSIFERLEGTSVMSVSDVENFASSGGVAEFVLIDANIKFRFNRQAAESAGLRPSARLLSLAILVEPAH